MFKISVLRVAFLASVLSTTTVQAENPLQNCYKNTGLGQFFAVGVEEIVAEGATPVFLLNDKQEVVGMISVSPERGSNGVAKVVTVNKIELCSSLETSKFYYTDGVGENLLKWIDAAQDEVQVSQDEGLLVVNASVVKKQDYATLVRAEFKAYDVFSEEDDVNTPENQAKPGFIQDWGLPKGSGEFFFYIPKTWSSK